MMLTKTSYIWFIWEKDVRGYLNTNTKKIQIHDADYRSSEQSQEIYEDT